MDGAGSGWMRGLVIGIDHYVHLPDRKQLQGCVNDALAVQAFLVERLQTPRDRIRPLLSAAPGRTVPAGATATASAVREAFARLVTEAEAGEEVVVFIAAHGVRISHATTGEYLYGFAPCDVTTSATGFAALILGSELNRLARALTSRHANLTIILDTCHSAGSVRAADQGVERRLIPDSANEWRLSAAEWEVFATAHPAYEVRPRAKGAIGSSGWLDAGGDLVVLAACRDVEVARECDWSDPRERRGVMTACLLDELARVPRDAVATLRWSDLVPNVQRAVKSFAVQQPVLEGRPERAVFGGEWSAAPPGFALTRTDEPGVVRIAGGALHGLEEGAEVSIGGVHARIERSTPTTSTARLVESREIDPGARAILVTPSTRALTTRVLVPPELVVGPLPQSPLISVVDRGPADIEIRRWRDRSWVLAAYDPAPSIPSVDDVIGDLGDPERPGFIQKLVAGIHHWARYRAIRDRTVPDDVLYALLEIALRVGATAALSERQRPDPSGVHHVQEGVPLWVEMTVRRPPKARLFVGIMLCSDDGNIIPVWPPPGGDPALGGRGADEWQLPVGQTLLVGEDRYTPAFPTVRHDQQASRYTFKVIACTLGPDDPPPDLASLAITETVQDAIDAAAAGAAKDLDGDGAPGPPRWCSWNLVVRAARG